MKNNLTQREKQVLGRFAEKILKHLHQSKLLERFYFCRPGEFGFLVTEREKKILEEIINTNKRKE